MRTETPGITSLYGEAKPTYYVIAVGGAAPEKKHSSRFAAEKEAERLAVQHPGTPFDVVKLKRRVVFSQPDDKTPPAEPAGRAEERAKQLAARADMLPGSWVRVSETHRLYPAQIGYLDRLGEGDDLSVYVRLADHGVVRVAPSSLTVLTKSFTGGSAAASEPAPELEAAEAAPEPSALRPLGVMLLDLLLNSAFGDRVQPEEDPEVAHTAMVRALPKDTEVYVIMHHGGPFSPGIVTSGHIQGPSGNPEAVWVCFKGDNPEEKPKLMEIDTACIRRVDDPDFKVTR